MVDQVTGSPPSPDVRDWGLARLRHLREQGDETRSRIVETALQLIGDRGFAATSTREISERLGFTKAALYYHFRTKDDLLLAIAEPAITGLAGLVERGSGAVTAVERRRVVEDYVAFVAAHCELIKVLSDDPSVRRSEALRAVSPLVSRLVQILSGTDTPDLAQSVRARAALGAVRAALLRAEPEEDSEIVRETAVAVALAVLGLPAARRGPRPPVAGTLGGATEVT